MAREMILSADRVLYSPAEPEGRLFRAGEQWPGDAWSDQKDAEPEDKAAKANAVKELLAAHQEIERLGAVITAGDHDRGKIADERDAALAQVKGLNQRALDAEKAQAEAEARHLETAAQRDQARIEAENERQRAARVSEPLAEAKATIERLTAELAAAQQAAADAKAQIAKFDKDGDGKTGGSRKGGL
jgi:chromosome segregation ATPase